MSSQYVVTLSEPAEMAYCELAGLAFQSPPESEIAQDFRAVDDLLDEKLLADPSSGKYRLAGKLGWLYRITVRRFAVCYVPFVSANSILVVSIVRILDGCQTGEEVWTRLWMSGEHIETLQALGLQRYKDIFTPPGLSKTLQ